MTQIYLILWGLDKEFLTTNNIILIIYPFSFKKVQVLTLLLIVSEMMLL